MGRKRSTPSSSSSSSQGGEVGISELHQRHQQEVENLTLTTQPFKTLKFFVLAIFQYVKQSILYLLAKGGWLMLLSTVSVAIGVLIMTIDGPHEKHVEELSRYIRFGLWWMALGVASSIGFGSGLHTFVMYLGPHIALFTLKAMQCGRVDLKSAPYDTTQLNRGPSWLDKNCTEFGPPLFQSLDGLRVPLSSILPQVQIEAVLWGIGTAIGELPPYFISRAGSMSGSKLDEAIKELDASSTEDKGVIATRLNQIKCWLVSHSQHLNFFTILVLAWCQILCLTLLALCVDNLGSHFGNFFATLIGKAIIKTHIQTAFIISVCNNQLLSWIENELIWMLSLIPGFASVLPNLIAKLNAVKDKYMKSSFPGASNTKENKWDFSLTSAWNTIVWLMLMNFFVKFVNSTAQSYLKTQLENEVAELTKKSSTSADSK